MSKACHAVQAITLDVTSDLVRRGIWEGRLTPISKAAAS
jgi:hypothetical protein